MTEPDRIKQRLRDSSTIEELRDVWEAEQDAISALPKTMRIQIVNMKEYRKADFERAIINQGAG